MTTGDPTYILKNEYQRPIWINETPTKEFLESCEKRKELKLHNFTCKDYCEYIPIEASKTENVSVIDAGTREKSYITFVSLTGVCRKCGLRSLRIFRSQHPFISGIKIPITVMVTQREKRERVKKVKRKRKKRKKKHIKQKKLSDH